MKTIRIIFVLLLAVSFVSTMVAAMDSKTATRIVTKAYEEILGRQPDPQGLKNYRDKLLNEGWTEKQVRDALRRSGEARSSDAEEIITRAFKDILHREPDAAGLASYKTKMVKEGWTEAQVREALRQSDEYQKNRVDLVIRGAYMDILGREPGPAGYKHYQQLMTTEHWTEKQVREDLMNSDEHKDARADRIIRKAYKELLGREPGTAGYKRFHDLIVNENWTERQVRDEIRNSEEYRKKHRS